jgi:hypothetical protein
VGEGKEKELMDSKNLVCSEKVINEQQYQRFVTVWRAMEFNRNDTYDAPANRDDIKDIFEEASILL